MVERHLQIQFIPHLVSNLVLLYYQVNNNHCRYYIGAPWYQTDLLPLDLGQLPLQSCCDHMRCLNGTRPIFSGVDLSGTMVRRYISAVSFLDITSKKIP